jgi:hypothetical protein
MDSSSVPTLPALLLDTYHETHPQSSATDLFNKQSTEYLTRLTGYSLNSLTSEPSRIADEHAFVGRELTSLCIGEYKSFVAVHQCKEHVKSALEEFDASLEELRRAIPELERECATFVQETSGIQSDRRRAQIVLEHQDKLVDLLDIPQLVDTCVRNGYYHEAMELTSHTRQLVSRYPDVPLVHSISAQVDSIMQLQLSQLVASLREPVKLPVLVKSIGFLRKMGSLEEDELRLAFLESRAQRWRDHVKEHVDKERSEPTRYVRRYVDAFRELQYDTVVQYTAIFLDPTPFRNQTSRKTSTDIGMDDNSRVQALDLIVRYAHHAVADLLHCITSHVPLISDPSSLASLLTQLGYTALSFARVGMDFSAYLPEVFENAVLGLTTSGWDNGLNLALDRLRPASTSQKSASPSGRLDIESVFVPGFLVSPEMLQTLTRSEPPQFAAPIHSRPNSRTVPPLYLSSYPLLAVYTNSTLTTLNSLRLLAPVAVFPSLFSHLLKNLADLGQALLDYANHSTGQADPLRGPPTRKRPEGLRRNTSISNRDQLAERTEARERHGRRVLSAILDAYVNGCAEFLKMALVEGVYDGQFGSANGLKIRGANGFKSNDDRFDVVAGQIRDWITRHAQKPASTDSRESKSIEEEEAPTSTIATTDAAEHTTSDQLPSGHSPTEDPAAAIPAAVPAESEEAVGYEIPTSIPEEPQQVAEKSTPSDGQLDSSPPLEQVAPIHEPSEDPMQAEQSQPGSEENDPDSISGAPLPIDSGPENGSPIDIATTVPEETIENDVVAQVQEIQLDNSETGLQQEMTNQTPFEPTPVEEPTPVQITEDVQVPEPEAELPDIDKAMPVTVVPDTSSDKAPAKENARDLTPAGNSDIDELDQLIAAKEAVESANSAKEDASDLGKGTEADPTETTAAALPEAPVPFESIDIALPTPPAQEPEVENAAISAEVNPVPSEIPPSDDGEPTRNATSQAAEGLISVDAAESAENGSAPLPIIADRQPVDVPAPGPVENQPESLPVASAQELASGEDDLPSGVVTPEEQDEAEGGPRPDAVPASNEGNANSGKAKKKKNKKKGKK